MALHHCLPAGSQSHGISRLHRFVLYYFLAICGVMGSSMAPELPQREARLIIVAPHGLQNALKPYVDFKNKFLPTELVDLEQILASSPGVDDPERLKRYLYVEWQQDRRLRYVLLVGDRDAMPVRYMVLDRVTPAAFDYAFYPSDLYYEDLAKDDGTFEDWNGAKDDFHGGYFGEVRGEKNKGDPINFDQVSYRPKIAVGRWPVSTEAEAQIIANKSMAYEKGIRERTHPGLAKMKLFHPAGWVDARSLASHLEIKGWSAVNYLFQDSNPEVQTPPPDAEQVISALNAGCGLCVHIGHGSEVAWEGSPNHIKDGGKGPILSTKRLAQLTNGDRLPVIFSCGCSTAHFAPLGPYERYVDIYGVDHPGTNQGETFKAPPPPEAPLQKFPIEAGLGKQLLVANPSGAVAYIGCNTGSQPCGLSLLEGFVKALGKAEQPALGECWTSAIDFYREHEHLETLKPKPDDWYPPSIFFQGMKFMLFGDPSLPMAGAE